MAKQIGIRLYLDGAKQFNSDIKEIDSKLKELRSEMKLNTEQYKNTQNSAEALGAKSQTLTQQYDKATEKVKLYTQRMEELRKAREGDQQKLDQYRAALEQEQKKLEEIERTSGKTSKEYETQAEKVGQLEGKTREMEKSISDLDSKEVQLQTSLNNATAEQVKYESELNTTNGYLKEAESSTDGLATSIDEYGKEVKGGKEETEKLSEALQNIAENEALEKLGEAAKKVLESLMDCAETAETFEYSIAKVQSIAQVSGDELGNMSDEIRRVATEMGYSANEVAEATYQAISASVDASEAVGFVSDTTKLARAGFTEVTTAVDVLTTAVNAYGKEANTTAHIADDLITTQNLGKTTVDELAQSMGTIIPTASAYGVSLDQLSAAYVILTKQGINTANATTYLRGMLNELGDAGSDVSDILYEMTGHTFGELTKMGYTLGDVLGMLGDSVDGNTESFANLFGNIRAGQGALAIFNQGADTFNDTLEIMKNNAGATDEAFAIMADTAEMTNQRFEASMENLKISIGESLSPTIQSLKETAIGMLEPITDFVERNPALISAIAGVATGIAAAATAAATLAGVLTAIKVVMSALEGPVGWATLAFGALAAVIGGGVGVAAASEDAVASLSKLNDKLQESRSKTEDAARTSADQAERARELAKRYGELAGQAHLTDDELNELNGIITELNSTVPGCSLAYRENKDAIEGATEATQSFIEAMIAEAEQSAYMTELTDLYMQRAEAERLVKESTEELQEIEEQEEYYHKQLSEGVTEAADAYDNMRGKVADLKEVQEESQQTLDDTNARIEEITGSLVEQQEEVEVLTDELGVAAVSAKDLEEAQKAIKDATEHASNAVSDQIGIFSEWKQESDLTLEDMKERWQQQTDGINQYKDDLSYLKQVIDTETDPTIVNLAENMVSMGVDSSAEIHNFVEGLKEINGNKDAMEDLAQTWKDHLEAIQSAEGLYEGIELQNKGYVEQAQALFDQYYTDSEAAEQTHYDNMVTIAETAVTNHANAITTHSSEVEDAAGDMAEAAVKAAEEGYGIQGGESSEFREIGETAGTSNAEGIKTVAPDVEDAAGEMAEGAITSAQTELGIEGGESSKFREIGENLTSSLADSIRDGESGIQGAMQSTLENAVNGMDMSGVVERINKKITDALNSNSGAIADAISSKINRDVQRQASAWK